MIEKGKISSLQMGILMYPTILATAILLVPAITANYAGRDMWISPMWASLIGFLTVYIVCRLNKIYPSETIIEYSKHIVGWLPGKVLGLLFLLFYFHDTGIVIREYGEFVAGAYLPHTPLFVVLGSMVLVCAFNVRGGLEVVGRTAQVFVPVVLFLFFCIVALLIPDLEPKNMLPVMEHGIVPSFRGSLVPQGWLSEFLLMSFLLPYLSDRNKGMKRGMIAVLLVTVTMIITNMATLFLFGDVTSTLTYPVMMAARYISVGEFFEHLESLVMAIWVAGTFMKISVFYYAIVLGSAQWLGLSEYRHLTLPIGFILVLSSIWAAPNLQSLSHFLSTASPFYFLLIQTAIPMVLLAIALMREKWFPKKGGG